MTLAKMFQLMLGTVGLRFGGAAIGLLTQLVLARALAPDDVGVVFLTMSVARYCIVAGDRRLSQSRAHATAAHLRVGPEPRGTGFPWGVF